MYHWVGTGDKYDPRGFHRGHIQSNMTMELCVAATNNQSTKARLWKTVHCDQLATYVCEIPLSKLFSYILSYEILVDWSVDVPKTYGIMYGLLLLMMFVVTSRMIRQ